MEVYYKFQSKRLLEENILEEDVSAAQISFHEPSVSMDFREFELEEFRNYMSPPKIFVPVQDASPSTTDEDSQIRDLIHAPALDWWQCHNATHSSGGLLERMIPTSSYICPRCKVPGHSNHLCPTNGHPTFGIRRTKPPTGIPHSMLTAAPDGSYALPIGDFAVLGPNEAAFEKEIQGIPAVSSTGLYCPLCRAVMKDAVLASKCCFKSFCEKCITDYIISNSLCFCGATNVLADDFLPNKTLRDTIIWFLEFSSCCGANGGSAFQPQGTESARFLQLKRDLSEFKIGFNCGRGPQIMIREESKGLKTTIKQKYDLESRSGGNMEVYRDRNSSRKMTGKKNVLSVKSKSMSITPPERCTHDPEFMCTSAKRKVKHDDDYYEEHSNQPPKKVRLHHHQSELVLATRLPILPDTVDLPPLPSQSSTKKTISDWKYEANVLAGITFPEGESAVFKKRKFGSYSSAVNGSSHHRSHCMTSNKYHEDHRNTAAAVLKNSYNYYADHEDHELRDDGRKFKRRPSRYESSPTPALNEGKHSNRGWREKGFTAASIGGLSVH